MPRWGTQLLFPLDLHVRAYIVSQKINIMAHLDDTVKLKAKLVLCGMKWLRTRLRFRTRSKVMRTILGPWRDEDASIKLYNGNHCSLAAVHWSKNSLQFYVRKFFPASSYPYNTHFSLFLSVNDYRILAKNNFFKLLTFFNLLMLLLKFTSSSSLRLADEWCNNKVRDIVTKYIYRCLVRIL